MDKYPLKKYIIPNNGLYDFYFYNNGTCKPMAKVLLYGIAIGLIMYVVRHIKLLFIKK